jgi:hypothetical protein
MRALLVPSPYTAALKSALIQQGIVLFIAASILDGGDIFAICVNAFIGFWVGVYLVRRRRPQTPTKLDLYYAKPCVRISNQPISAHINLSKSFAFIIHF